MKYALIAAIEGNAINLNNKLNIVDIPRRLEDEAILCFTNWRQNGGWLSNIPIYVLCPTKNTITATTVEKLNELGVTYIEEYHPITETFTSGFLNIPYVGMLFEDRLDVDVLIKIDLDMNLIQPLPPSLVNSGTVCGQYDDYCTKMQRSAINGNNPFDTGFLITNTAHQFYKKWWAGIDEILYNRVQDDEWDIVRAHTGEYYLEEYVVDKLYNKDPTILTPIQRYQIGEWYTPVSKFTDAELLSVYFWHEHLISDPKYNKVREKVEYFNRMAKIRRMS